MISSAQRAARRGPDLLAGCGVGKSVVKNVAQYGLGVALLSLVVWLNWDGLVRAFAKPLNPLMFLLAGVVCAVSLLVTLFRWYILVRAQGLPFARSDALRLGMVGYFFNTFLPGSIGGDLIKAWFIAREQPSRRPTAVATVVVDRLVGLTGIFWLVSLVGGAAWLLGAEMLVTKPRLQMIVTGAATVAAVTLVLWGLLGWLPDWRADRFARRLEWLPKVGRPLAEVWRAVRLYRSRTAAMAAALALSVAGHCGFVLTFFLAISTFDLGRPIPTLAEHYVIVPAGLTGQAIVPTPGGVGGGEAGFGGLYRLIGYEASDGVLGSLAQRVITWVLGIIGGLIFVNMRRSGAITEQVAEAAEGADAPAQAATPAA